jgi:ribosome-binding protein aMBF1 (putative translation factor)
MSIYQDWTPVNIGNGKNKKAFLKKQSQALPVKTDENEDPPKFVPFSQKLLDELAEARRVKELKQSDIAKQLMIKPQEIQDLESGKCDFNSKRAKSLYVAIMKKLGVNTNMASLNNS